jgi:hypothetical protein
VGEAPDKIRWGGTHQRLRSTVGRRCGSEAMALVIGEALVRGGEKRLALENRKPEESVRRGSNVMKAGRKGGSPCRSVGGEGGFAPGVSTAGSDGSGGQTQEGIEGRGAHSLVGAKNSWA